MWWNGRFTSLLCSWQICSSCVMLSSQYGPKSLRNVYNTLLNLCHEELRQFRRQKGSNPVYQGVPNKLASECIYSYTKQEGAESARRSHSNNFQCTRKSLIWTKVSSYHCMIWIKGRNLWNRDDICNEVHWRRYSDEPKQFIYNVIS